MHRTIHHIHRASIVGLVLSVIVAIAASVFATPKYALADQVSNRSIQMSDSGASGGSIPSGNGSGTNVSYTVSFGLSTNAAYAPNMESYIVDFCAESPIPSDTCTGPAGLDLSTATATGGNTAGWTITTAASQIKATDPTGIVGGSTVTLEMSGITNPSTVGTFYARIYTYADTTWGGYTGPTSIGSNVDYGGIALSTTAAISVSAAVEEQITFCVSGSVIGAGCSGLTPSNLVIGHGIPPIVDGTQVDTGSAYIQTTTNAQSGAAVRIKNSYSCGGLSSNGGVTCPIPPAGSAAIALAAGTPDYGMNVEPSTGGIGTMDPSAPYNQSGSSKYAMVTSAGNGVTSTYGSQIASSSLSGAVFNVDNILNFAAAVSNVTPANSYTATMILITTGTF